MRGNSQNGGQTTKSLLTKPQCSGVPIQQAVSLSSSFPRHCLLFVCAFFREMQESAGRKNSPCPRLLHTKPPRLPSRKPGRFVCFRGAFSGAHAKPCEGSFGKPRVCGESATPWHSTPVLWDHPRVCGGKGHLTLAVSHMHRINPAYAGKRLSLSSCTVLQRDHPRVCGEKASAAGHCSTDTGSPPHMRGKGQTARKVVVELGITPAYAGKRLKRSRSTVPPVAIVPLFPSVCNKPVVSDGSPAGRDAPLFLPAENAAPAPASPAGSCPASRPSQFPPRIMVISPRP